LSDTGHIILGITGGIAAYKACDLVRLFVKDKFRVYPVMTQSAAKLVSPLTLSYLASNKVYYDIFDEKIDWNVEHVTLAEKADLMLIAPATANIIAKLAVGLADDFVSLTALTFAGTMEKPLVVAPAMNFRMYRHPATQKNIEILKNRGVHIIEPEVGELACGETGEGRLADIKKIHETVNRILNRNLDFDGVRVIVTAGGTREPIDSVRVITNRSSGKMGYALANQLKRRGAVVTLMTSSNLPDPPVDRIIRFETVSQLREELDREFDNCDLLLMTAAVSDFTVSKPTEGKLHRSEGAITIELIPTEDIIGHVAERKGKRFVVGFAAETAKLADRAKEKLKSKNLDMIVANDISREDIGFDSDQNEAFIITQDEKIHLAKNSKEKIAAMIADEISTRIGKK
jgi:phosphopantothenoylcysteine decarboxylase/phosphopantothenate--cysteine ligase